MENVIEFFVDNGIHIASRIGRGKIIWVDNPLIGMLTDETKLTVYPSAAAGEMITMVQTNSIDSDIRTLGDLRSTIAEKPLLITIEYADIVGRDNRFIHIDASQPTAMPTGKVIEKVIRELEDMYIKEWGTKQLLKGRTQYK